ncbi:MAG: hypothetical protein ACR2K6_06385 [Solirubrobacterales bacterium]
MPTHLFSPLRAALFGVLCAALLIPAAAGATRPAELRAVDSGGETLAQHTQYTGKSKIKTSPDADCFGEGTGGSGEKVTVPGATALGILDDATGFEKANRFAGVKPLGVSDFFDFGITVCEIGGAVAPSTGYWYLKVNHIASQAGADGTRLRTDDQVLWYLITDFEAPVPLELELEVQARAERESVDQVGVQVWEYADDGSRSPAKGATVTGASKPTNGAGRTKLDEVPEGGLSDLQAAREGSIPSAFEPLCVADDLDDCQTQPPADIFGSDKKDVIRGTRGDDRIYAGKGKDVVRAKKGDDFVNVRGGGRDIVRCGGGIDTVRADKRDKLKGCG